jgi:hypothetical protein
MAINPSSGVYDYTISSVSGDRQWVFNSEAIALSLKQRLLLSKGEWPFDINEGIPWLDLMEKPINKILIDSLIKKRIIDTNGVLSIVSYESIFDSKTREFTINFRYTDKYSSEAQELSLSFPG